MSKIYVDDVNVSTKELCVILGIDPATIPTKLTRIYEINPSKVTKDANGNEKTPRRCGIQTKFNVYLKGQGKSVQVRYAKDVINENKNGFVVPRYSPGQLFINGKEELVQDDLEHFFRYINPDCYNSPFREMSRPWRYLFKDNEANAKNDLLRDEQEMRAMSMIIGQSALPTSQLRQIAKGMNIGGVDALTDAEVKNKLKVKAKENPNKFYDDATSRSIQFSGLLQDVVDQSIVRVISNNGYKRWYFVNEELCVIPSGANEMEVLKDTVTRKMDLIPQFMTALEGRSVESELSKPENAHFFDAFKPNPNETRGGVSPNIKAENKEIDADLQLKAEIKALAEEEDAELAGTTKMHWARKGKLERLREEVDAYKASL